MTIEEMVSFIKNAAPLGKYPPGSREQIIAALRAGQAMETVLRHALDLGYFSPGGSTEGMANRALQAWDAATKGDE